MERRLFLSIVIPVFKSKAILPVFFNTLILELKEINLLLKTEIILVDDCSNDGSWEEIQKLSKNYKNIKGLKLKKNVGQHNAILAGLHIASGDYIVLMDDDGQHLPSSIREIIDKLQSGYDVCYTKYIGRNHNLLRIFFSSIANRFAKKALGFQSDIYLSSFKGFNKSVKDEILKYESPFVYIDGLIHGVTSSITSIDTVHMKRVSGKSSYSSRKLISLMLKLAINFSFVPIRFVSLLSIIFGLCSVVLFFVIIFYRLTHPEVPQGWSSLAALVLFLASIQLLCIGIIGEYVGRALTQTNKTPQFVIDEKTFK
jgi:glycosyltransferase involved in cell wall biosynthesis